MKNRTSLSIQEKGFIIEKFTNGNTLISISQSVGKSRSLITKCINENYFFKQRSYDTITLVMDSKINYYEPDQK